MRDAPDRGVSPVIGGVLLVAIVVLLAAVLGALALGMEGGLQEPTPHASFSVSYDPTGDGNGGDAYLTITHESGSISSGAAVYVVDGDGNRIAWEDIWTGEDTVESGGYAHVDGIGSDCVLNYPSEGEVYRVVWESGDGSSRILARHEVDEPPANPGTYPC